MPSVLFTASTFSHILSFHVPYLRRFKELGWRVEVACGGAVREIPCADAVVSLPLEKKMTAPANFRAAGMLRQRMARERYDLVITHTSLAAFFTRWAAKGLRERPAIVNVVHGYLFDERTGGVKKTLLTAAEKMTAPQTDLLLTMNRWDDTWARENRCAGRVAFIPGMGVELERFQPSPEARRDMRERLHLAEEDVALIYPAEFSGRKNHAMLLRAMVQLPQSVKLLLPGRGALLERSAALAKELGVAERVVFPGFTEEIPAWLAAADIAVSASRSEGLPFNIMESMSCALPVVASRVKGHTDLVTEGENGFLFPYDDENSFAGKVRQLAEDRQLRAQMGQNGRQKVQPYRLDAVLPQVMELYMSAAGGIEERNK